MNLWFFTEYYSWPSIIASSIKKVPIHSKPYTMNCSYVKGIPIFLIKIYQVQSWVKINFIDFKVLNCPEPDTDLLNSVGHGTEMNDVFWWMMWRLTVEQEKQIRFLSLVFSEETAYAFKKKPHHGKQLYINVPGWMQTHL